MERKKAVGRPMEQQVDKSAYRSKVGKLIRDARKAKGWSLDQLSEASKVSRSMLSEYENGQADQSIVKLRLLTKALGIRINELLPFEKPTNPRSGDG